MRRKFGAPLPEWEDAYADCTDDQHSDDARVAPATLGIGSNGQRNQDEADGG